MDQYLRSLGEVKTYYASKMSVAIESFNEKKPSIVFCEQTFSEGSVLEFIQAIGGLSPSREQYFVLAAEEASDDLVSLAVEKGIDEILVKPFSTDNIHQIVERYFEKLNTYDLDWVKALKRGRISHEEKRFQEAEEIYANCAKNFIDNPAATLECAEFFLSRGHAQMAEHLAQRVISASPDNVRALSCAASALKKQGKLFQASELFDKANHLSPLNSLRHVELAETMVAMAEEEINSALKCENENTMLILTKARYQLMRKDYAAMVVYLDAKKAFLSEAGRKEADLLIAIAKKISGLR